MIVLRLSSMGEVEWRCFSLRYRGELGFFLFRIVGEYIAVVVGIEGKWSGLGGV